MDSEKALYEAMKEAALLPPEDSFRQQIESQIAEEGAAAEEAWLRVLQEDEQVRIALRRIEVPGDLEAKLLEIPERQIASKHWFFAKPLVYSLATVVVLVIGSAILLRRFTNESVLQAVITLAVNDHLNERHIRITAGDPQQILAAANQALPFHARLPNIGREFRLLGADTPKLGTSSVFYSLWATALHEYSLFQFRLTDFGLRPKKSSQLIKPRNPTLKRSPCEVLFWSDEDYGYLLVADHGEYLVGINPKPDEPEKLMGEYSKT